MKRVITLLLGFFTILFLITAAAATAENVLPTVLLLEGSSASLVAESATAAVEFHSTTTLSGKGYKFTLETKAAMTSLGPGTFWFKEAALNGKKCNSAGDTTGNVLTPVEWHTVLALSGGTKLFLVLVLLKAFELECVEGSEKVKVLINGDELFDAEPFGEDVTTMKATAECEKSTSKYTEYDADTGMETANLKATVAGVKGNLCLSVEGTMEFRSSAMFEVMEP